MSLENNTYQWNRDENINKIIPVVSPNIITVSKEDHLKLTQAHKHPSTDSDTK